MLQSDLIRKRLIIFCISLGFLFMHGQVLPMQNTNVYDSDSEDDYGYQYFGDRPLYIPRKNCKAVVLFRGIHFSPSIFGKKERSNARKLYEAGMPIFSLAAYKDSKSKCTSRVPTCRT